MSSRLSSGRKALDTDLVEIANINTTSFGRNLLALQNQLELRQAAGLGASGSSRYVRSLIDGDLSTEGKLIIYHELGYKPAAIRVISSTNYEINPDEILDIDNNSLLVGLDSFRPLIGIYTIIIGD